MNGNDAYEWHEQMGIVRSNYLVSLFTYLDSGQEELDWENIFNFTPREFDSPDVVDSGWKMNRIFVGKLDLVREILGCGVSVSGGIRTPERNEIVGGADDSYHLVKYGLASDIYSRETSLSAVYRACEFVGFGGLGIYPDQGFVHCDDRPIGKMSRWICRYIRDEENDLVRDRKGNHVREYIYSI